MNIKMQAEYGGYLIIWNDYGKMFEILKDGIEIKTHIETLENCKKWIDAKNKQKFNRIQVIHQFSYYGDKQFAEVTSMVGENCVWVSSGDKRGKANVSDVWLDTPKNRQALIDIKDKQDQIVKLQNEIREIENATERLTAEVMMIAGSPACTGTV